MVSQKEKGFRKLNKSNIVSVLILTIVIGVLICAFLSLFGVFFFRYFIDSRIRNEFMSVSYMSRLYENADDKDEVIPLLDKEGRSYFITDKDGRILHLTGENTCSMEGLFYNIDETGEDAFICSDVNAGIITTTANSVSFDPLELKNRIEGDIKTYGEDFINQSVNVPMWIAISQDSGAEYMYAQMFFSISYRDLVFILTLVAILALVVIVGFISVIIMLIRGFSRQRKLNNLFFMDDVTGNRNWMWFQLKAEKIICKSRYAGTNFAVLELVFVKYRNFCMCHSIEEGERILRRIDDLVADNLIKKTEMCAHYASANFSILMTYSNETQLRARINDIINKLEHLDDSHKLTFHVGVCLLGVQNDSAGKALRRKNISIDREYNNACTARTTLDSSDDSGVAFFNDKLLEEQKWLDIVQEKQQSALDNEEFVVYYQPKYDPQTDKLKGAEALIRWNSPEFGFKGPGAFIPIFEKNGFITEIDHYIYDKACGR